ncbi:hypothetical protein Taro_018875 [Colocasia esculenta]|uniref:Uncharacterized protein n=1 Tax=Colocasia esculenta TaxID=4460 RepID=A0A843UV40_COLES|nr:hypothetical protein [Colocasia esculenta]
MPITDPSHTFHSASSSGHHVTEEHMIEEDEVDEIDSQDDIDDNENMDEGDDEPLFHIARSCARLYVGRPDIAMHPLAQDMPLGHRVQPISGPVDALDSVTRKGRRHIDWATYFAHFVQMWHRQRDYIIPLDEDTSYTIGRVQRTYSSTSDARPSEPCVGSSQQPGDAGLSQFSPDVMTFSQHGLYDMGASQILTNEVMPDEITHS